MGTSCELQVLPQVLNSTFCRTLNRVGTMEGSARVGPLNPS